MPHLYEPTLGAYRRLHPVTFCCVSLFAWFKEHRWQCPKEMLYHGACMHARRVWRGGRCLAVLQGHTGRGVWRMAVMPRMQLATAGACAPAAAACMRRPALGGLRRSRPFSRGSSFRKKIPQWLSVQAPTQASSCGPWRIVCRRAGTVQTVLEQLRVMVAQGLTERAASLPGFPARWRASHSSTRPCLSRQVLPPQWRQACIHAKCCHPNDIYLFAWSLCALTKHMHQKSIQVPALHNAQACATGTASTAPPQSRKRIGSVRWRWSARTCCAWARTWAGCSACACPGRGRCGQHQEEHWQQLWQSARGQPLGCIAVSALQALCMDDQTLNHHACLLSGAAPMPGNC